MTVCSKCGSNLVELHGKLLSDKPQELTVKITLCDCWLIYWDATNRIGFDAKIQDKKTGNPGELFPNAKSISSIVKFYGK